MQPISNPLKIGDKVVISPAVGTCSFTGRVLTVKEIQDQMVTFEEMDSAYSAHLFAKVVDDDNRDLRSEGIANAINNMVAMVHGENVAAGWWSDLRTGQRIERNMGELLCLVHSEISEAMEGHRNNLQDDKLPHRKMLEVELADTIIRIFDIAGGHGLDLGGAFIEKRAFNARRLDHKIEARQAEGGKAY